jgi:hypothetical protein
MNTTLSDTLAKRKVRLGELSEYQNDRAFQYEGKEGASAWDRFIHWLIDWLHQTLGIPEHLISTETVEWIIRGVAMLIVAVIAFKLYQLYRKKQKDTLLGSSDESWEKYGELYTVQQEEPYEKRLRKALNEGDQRAAIRFYYLWVLYELSVRDHIQWHIDKTNNDYIQEIKNQEIRQLFADISYWYAYVWYGEYPVTDDLFGRVETQCVTLMKLLP